jgi:hypothetical protein
MKELMTNNTTLTLKELMTNNTTHTLKELITNNTVVLLGISSFRVCGIIGY